MDFFDGRELREGKKRILASAQPQIFTAYYVLMNFLRIPQDFLRGISLSCVTGRLRGMSLVVGGPLNDSHGSHDPICNLLLRLRFLALRARSVGARWEAEVHERTSTSGKRLRPR